MVAAPPVPRAVAAEAATPLLLSTAPDEPAWPATAGQSPPTVTIPPVGPMAADLAAGPGSTSLPAPLTVGPVTEGPAGTVTAESPSGSVAAETLSLFSGGLPAAAAFPGRHAAMRPQREATGTQFAAPPDVATQASQPAPAMALRGTGEWAPSAGPRDGGSRFPGSPHRRPRSRSRRTRILAIGLGAVVIVVGGAAAAVLLLRHHHASQPSAAPRPAPTEAPSIAPSSAPATPTPAPTPTVTPSSAAIGPAGWTLPKPIDQQAYQNDTATIASISCVTAVKCFAADSSGNVLASKSANSWHTVATDSQSNLVSISCANARFCAAVDDSGDVVVFENGSWSDPVSIDSDSGLTGVSCPTATFCMAVDDSGNAFTFTGTVTNWPKSTLDPNQDAIASVSCDSATFCAAVDRSGNAYTYDGNSWTSAGNVDNDNELVQVSCASPAFCAAVDSSGNAVTFIGSTWSAGSMPSTAVSVSCPAAGYCVAVDASGGAVDYQQGSWSKVSKIDGNNSFTAISCVGVNTCTAADQYDNVMYYGAPEG